MSSPRRSDQLAAVAPLHPPRERWLTFKEASEALYAQHGYRVAPRTLDKWCAACRKAGRPEPSRMNMGRRQVQLSQLLPWLHDRGSIEEAA